MQPVTTQPDQCEHGHDRREQHPANLRISIICNGVTERFHAESSELVGTLLKRALQEFQVVNNPHIYALYNAAGNELADALSLAAANVYCGDQLLLRPSSVRAG